MKKSRPDKKGSERAPAAKTPPAEPSDRGLERLKKIVAILEASSLAELSYEDGEISVALSRHATAAPAASGPMAAPPPARADAPPAPAPTEQAPTNIHVVRSPFIGTFYTSPSPTAQAFVEVGGPVRRGQTLCIVEAMKLMNEIECEVDGTVLEVLRANGSPVQFGDELFKIKKR